MGRVWPRLLGLFAPGHGILVADILCGERKVSHLGFVGWRGKGKRNKGPTYLNALGDGTLGDLQNEKEPVDMQHLRVRVGGGGGREKRDVWVGSVRQKKKDNGPPHCLFHTPCRTRRRHKRARKWLA